MKKILLTLVAAGLCLSAAYSYNPPAGGEDLTLVSSPANLSGMNSVSGGALFDRQNKFKPDWFFFSGWYFNSI